MVVLLNVFANWMAWRHPRAVQHAAKAIVSPVMGFLLDRPAPMAEFRREDISPFFWVNGNMPTCDEWKTLAAGDFKDYRLKVYGLVENPVELSLDDLRALGKKTQITLHHCIQGWSGIAEWGGLPLAELIEVGPAGTQCQGGRLLLVQRGRRVQHGRRGRPILRQPLDRERSEPANIAGLRDERPAAQSSARGAVAAACREPARLQDGQVDPGDRIRRGRPDRSTRAKAATPRTTNTSANWPTSRGRTATATVSETSLLRREIMKRAQKLHAMGQSLWLDNVTRRLLTSRSLQRYIQDFSITGLTSNPTIFDHAIKGSHDYASQSLHQNPWHKGEDSGVVEYLRGAQPRRFFASVAVR